MGGGRAGAAAAATVSTSSTSGLLSLAPASWKGSDTLVEPDAPSTPSTKEWGEFWDEEVGASYYYNSVTGEALWVRPDGF